MHWITFQRFDNLGWSISFEAVSLIALPKFFEASS